MDRVPKIKALYRELNEIHLEMKPFVTPSSADNPRHSSLDELTRYYTLHKRLGKVIVELAKLEGGLP